MLLYVYASQSLTLRQVSIRLCCFVGARWPRAISRVQKQNALLFTGSLQLHPFSLTHIGRPSLPSTVLSIDLVCLGTLCVTLAARIDDRTFVPSTTLSFALMPRLLSVLAAI